MCARACVCVCVCVRVCVRVCVCESVRYLIDVELSLASGHLSVAGAELPDEVMTEERIHTHITSHTHTRTHT